MTETKDLLTLKSVFKAYGNVPVLDDIDLAIRDGEFLTVLGPSGSGKTTVLRLIAGLEPLSSGAILLDGSDISKMPTNRRPFNTVFQDYALFPHLSVADNVGYGLSVRRTPRQELKRRVAEALTLVQLESFAKRYPAQLSGGQRQRVALARALICQPRLILLDEPLAALDLELRRQMQDFLKSIQREIKTTFLFVTHDQEEAISMADRICVMQSGRIRQLGTPHELYYRPNCEFVARFFGENNLIPGRLGAITDGMRAIDTEIGQLVCAIGDDAGLRAAAEGTSAFAAFRPEAVQIESASPVLNQFSGRLIDVAFGGASTLARIAVGAGSDGVELRMRVPSRIGGSSMQPGEPLSLALDPTDAHLVLA
jgi:spermidine/putrescine transport system ATP-binding protein